MVLRYYGERISKNSIKRISNLTMCVPIFIFFKFIFVFSFSFKIHIYKFIYISFCFKLFSIRCVINNNTSLHDPDTYYMNIPLPNFNETCLLVEIKISRFLHSRFCSIPVRNPIYAILIHQ